MSELRGCMRQPEALESWDPTQDSPWAHPQPTSLLADRWGCHSITFPACAGSTQTPGTTQSVRTHRTSCAGSGTAPPGPLAPTAEHCGALGRDSDSPPPRFTGLRSSGNRRGGPTGVPQGAGPNGLISGFLPLWCFVFLVEHVARSPLLWFLGVAHSAAGIAASGLPSALGLAEPQGERVGGGGATVQGPSPSLSL